MFTKLKTSLNHPRVKEARHEFEKYIKAVRSTLNESLFEASNDFWSYHIGGIVVLLTFDLALNSILTSSSVWNFYSTAGITWGACFFFAGLVLRSHYKNANWETQTQSMVLIKTIVSCMFFGFFVVLAMSFISMSLYFDDYLQYRRYQNANVWSVQIIIEFFFRNWFATSFYLLCWMMLYIGITSRRKAKQIEIDNLRLQNSLKEAELSSLSNQLNPHFLFNALNNIRFMIHEDANNAETMLMSLSSVLRYSLDSSKNEKVPFEEELEISHRYIDLIQIQFEERLNFSLDIPKQLSECYLPPMVLQMLLENAVKHGIDNIREGGTITVEAKLEDQTMILIVCNDLPADYASTTKEPGIGLYNIGQRLDLLYGAQGSIKTEVVENKFCVTVEIPQE